MQYLIAVICSLAILAGQYFYGGFLHPAFALPAYLLVGVAAVFSFPMVFLRSGGGIRGICLLSFVLFSGWMIWRCLDYRDVSLSGFYLRLVVACAAMYLVMGCAVLNPLPRIVFILILMAGAVIQGVVGAAQVGGIWPDMPQGWLFEQFRDWYGLNIQETKMRRAHGFYLNANHLAWFLNAAGLFGLAVGCLGRLKAWLKILLIYFGIMCLAAQMLCLSRGGWFGLAAGLLTFVVTGAVAVGVGAPSRRIAMAVIVIAGMALSAGVIWIVTDQNVAVQLRLEKIVADDYREDVWRTVCRQFESHPLLGGGPGSFYYYGRAFRDKPTITDDYFAHNDWVQTLGDFGYPGFALLLIFLLLHVTGGWKTFVSALKERMAWHTLPQSNTAAILAGALAISMAFAAHSFFDFNLQIPANALLAAACFGILSSAPPASSRKWEKESIFGSIGILLASMLGMGLLILVWNARSSIFALQAENFLLKGALADAKASASAGLAQNANDARLNRILAETTLQMGKGEENFTSRMAAYRDAERAIFRAISLCPDDRTNYMILSELAIRQNHVNSAMNASVETIRLDPRKANGYEFYGITQEILKNDTMAFRAYDISVRLPLSGIGRVRRAELLKRFQAENAATGKK